MPTAKKVAVKEAVNTDPNVYQLSPAAKKIQPKEIKAATHKGACLLALRKLGKAPFSDILVEVQRQKKIKTGMDVDKAVRWMLFDMVRKGLLIAK